MAGEGYREGLLDSVRNRDGEVIAFARDAMERVTSMAYPSRTQFGEVLPGGTVIVQP